MNPDRISVMVKEPNRPFIRRRIDNTLEALQEIVGGYIEVVTLVRNKAVLICNEEGKINDLPYNCQIGDDLLFGTIIIAGVDGEEFSDCPNRIRGMTF